MIPNDPNQLIARTYLDSAGDEHHIAAATIQRLRGALGTPPADAPATGPIVARPGQPVPATGRLLLEIVALESHRLQAMVVGEDLGTVAPGLREEMAARNMLSYRLLWFEEEPTDAWPVAALATVSTHDLPTVAGLWTGADLADQQAGGLDADAASTEQLRDKLAELTQLPADADAGEVTGAAYRLLARAPSRLLAASLEDAAGVELRPNLPGTTRPENWSRPLPISLEELDTLPNVAALVQALASIGRTDDRVPAEAERRA